MISLAITSGLFRYKQNPANEGQLFTSGFLCYACHPNYFGDAVSWREFYLLVATYGAWWTIFSPLLMAFLLRRVSGVSMLESIMRETKPGYGAYAAQTNPFIPGQPKKLTRWR